VTTISMLDPARICTRCVMDTSDPDITFDDQGVCSHCRRADRLLAAIAISPEESERRLQGIAERMRQAGSGKEYDSIIGLSGGVDSSYAAYLAHRLGLKPLAVHFDNGWNSEIAVQNIHRIVESCGFDLYTYVVDWREFRDLQRAFLMASVVDIELLTDNAIIGATINLAREHGVRFLLSGYNTATEHGLPDAWVWHKLDWMNIKAIHKAYGTIPLKTFPHISTTGWRLSQLRGPKIEIVRMLDLVSYRRDEAAATLAKEFGWREYGGKHHESVFTRFYQDAILPTKFGIDKRKVHLSDLIRNGEITRDDAITTLSRPSYDPDQLRTESEYVRKKLGFSETEWQAIMEAPPRSHAEFASDRKYTGPIRLALRFGRAMRGAIAGSPARA
jgi:N-acetyl sugar amidotransferase